MLFQTQKLTLPAIHTAKQQQVDDYTAKGGAANHKENLKPSSSGGSGRSSLGVNGPHKGGFSSVGASIVFKNNVRSH
jgi:hypothetical protein